MFSPTDPSLTLTNLTQLLEDVRYLEYVAYYLNIPRSVYSRIKTQQSSKSERWKACWEWYLNNHPCPSWRHIADALYMRDEHGVLEVLKNRYLKGECGSLMITGMVDLHVSCPQLCKNIILYATVLIIDCCCCCCCCCCDYCYFCLF